jgi:hypothetical protein
LLQKTESAYLAANASMSKSTSPAATFCS